MGYLRRLCGTLEALFWDTRGTYVGHMRRLCGTLEALMWET